MNAAIAANVSSVLATVSETYATQDRVGKLETWKNQAEQKVTADAIVSTVTSSSSWGDKADKATLISQINQSAEQIKIRGSIIDLQGKKNFLVLSRDLKNHISEIKKYIEDTHLTE